MTQPASLAASPPISLHTLRSSCSACSMHQLCLPMGLGESDMQRLDQIIGRRRKVPKDTLLYRMDDSFTNLYAIRLGHFKTYQVSAGR
jgi:CRP/FNR family transcriptional regulator